MSSVKLWIRLYGSRGGISLILSVRKILIQIRGGGGGVTPLLKELLIVRLISWRHSEFNQPNVGPRRSGGWNCQPRSDDGQFCPSLSLFLCSFEGKKSWSEPISSMSRHCSQLASETFFSMRSTRASDEKAIGGGVTDQHVDVSTRRVIS